MHNRPSIWIAALACGVAGWSSVHGATRQPPCDQTLTREIPTRLADAPGGRVFGEEIRGLSDDEREDRIQRELLAGNIPAFLRRLVPIHLHQLQAKGHAVDIVVCAAPDYLAIGSDDDFMLIPMRLGTALSLAAHYGFTLPTARLVDAIYAQAAVHFVPQPLPASEAMRSTVYYWRHNEMIETQRSMLGVSRGALSAGDKKDLVITNRLWGHLDRVAIYGWHRSDGEPIQPLSTVHGWHYADYSHGARLISTQVFVDGVPRSIFEVLQDPRLAGALSGEGIMANMTGLIATLSARAGPAIAAVLPDLHASLQ
jgi:hypothetical protein